MGAFIWNKGFHLIEMNVTEGSWRKGLPNRWKVLFCILTLVFLSLSPATDPQPKIIPWTASSCLCATSVFCVSDPAPESLWHDKGWNTPTVPHARPGPHLSRFPWSKAWYGMSRKSRWSHRRPCQWAEEWGVRRKWKSNWTGSWWSRGSVDSTVRFPAWKRNKIEVVICAHFVLKSHLRQTEVPL